MNDLKMYLFLAPYRLSLDVTRRPVVRIGVDRTYPVYCRLVAEAKVLSIRCVNLRREGFYDRDPDTSAVTLLSMRRQSLRSANLRGVGPQMESQLALMMYS